MLQPYTGPWNFEQAAHLLRRTTFGPNKDRIQQALDEGMEGTFQTLFSAPPPRDLPVYYDFDLDPQAGIGETWVGKPIDDSIPDIYFARYKTVFNGWLRGMRQDNQTITERLTLFWHNHFVVSESGTPNMNWKYFSLLREFALGNFREMTKRVTIDQSMLIYLNGTLNFKDEPNENYARELLELFTIGKGPLAGPGDYTNYTEQDVAAIARALTGWFAWIQVPQPAQFWVWNHDTGSKQLSHRFDNQVIPNAGADEYKNVIDIIFEKEEVSRHICRRLYTWFVYYDLNPTIEAEIIEPMAQILRDNDYNIQPALEALLRSQHFFDTAMQGCMIKNIFEYFFSVFNTWNVSVPEDFAEEQMMWLVFHFDMQELGMSVMSIPSVAGWRAYHQAPVFYRDWITSASVALRTELITKINGIINYVSPGTVGIDLLQIVESMDNPADVNSLIEELSRLYYPRPMIPAQHDYFKEALIPGLPDFEWTVEYEEYLANPNNQMVRQTIELRLLGLFFAMITVPEFQMM